MKKLLTLILMNCFFCLGCMKDLTIKERLKNAGMSASAISSVVATKIIADKLADNCKTCK